MNKINPLILIPVLVLILLILLYGVSHLKNSMIKNQDALFALENNAKKIVTLKKIWNKTNLEERLKSIFGAQSVSDKGRIFTINSASLTREQANDMIKKTFGEAFEIEKFVITADSNDRISLTLEIIK
jgi:hypothetical protein